MGRTGVKVIVISFGDVDQISTKKMRFSLKNIIIHFFISYIAECFVEIAIFSEKIF
jgi:hypothetical protein